MKRGKKKSTINRDVIALRALLSKAVEWDILELSLNTALRRGEVSALKWKDVNSSSKTNCLMAAVGSSTIVSASR